MWQQPGFFSERKNTSIIFKKENDEYLDTFIKLGNIETCDEKVYDEVELFVCKMYGFKSISKIDQVRLAIFNEM